MPSLSSVNFLLFSPVPHRCASVGAASGSTPPPAVESIQRHTPRAALGNRGSTSAHTRTDSSATLLSTPSLPPSESVMDGASGPRASGVSPRGGSAAGAGSVHSSSTTPPPSTLHSVNGLAHDAHAHTNGGAPPPLVPVTHTPTGGLHDLSGLSAAAASVAQALLHETALRLTRHQYKEAIVAYDRILELTPTFIPAWTGKGVCYKALKDHVSAVHCFQRGLQLDPTDWFDTHPDARTQHEDMGLTRFR